MNLSSDRIRMLIIKHLNGELDDIEKIELQDWVNQSEANKMAVEDFLDSGKLKRESKTFTGSGKISGTASTVR